MKLERNTRKQFQAHIPEESESINTEAELVVCVLLILFERDVHGTFVIKEKVLRQTVWTRCWGGIAFLRNELERLSVMNTFDLDEDRLIISNLKKQPYFLYFVRAVGKNIIELNDGCI